uniref:Uncharacterized protein n=1 Tax=Brassica oleracea var. oleracea TaxID=109376 RepID=A0A0D3CY55_BRAOL
MVLGLQTLRAGPGCTSKVTQATYETHDVRGRKLRLVKLLSAESLDAQYHLLIIKTSAVDSWTGEIRRRVVCHVCADSSIRPDDHVIEG